MAPLAVACAATPQPDGNGPITGGGAAGEGGDAGQAGAGGGFPPEECDGEPCPALSDALKALGASACCTEADRCGKLTPLSEECLEPEQPGSVAAACPSLPAPALGATLEGCCRPDARCGVLDPSFGSGCIAREAVGAEAIACAPSDGGACTLVAELPCDGPEDCAGRQCCAAWDGGPFHAFACIPRCSDADPTGAALWFELCHADQDCSQPDQRCRASPELPGFLYRCYVDGAPAPDPGDVIPGVVACGERACSGDRVCCLRSPQAPYCARPGECACEPSDAGSDADAADADAGPG